MSKIKWILELIDLYKDWVYLFAFIHQKWAFCLLIASIVLPFAIVESAGNDGNNFTVAHSFLNYIGLTEDDQDQLNRTFAVFLMAGFENIPQFIIVICEIFQLKYTVTFTQAGNPIFALCMTFKAIGPLLGVLFVQVNQLKQLPLKIVVMVFSILIPVPLIIASRSMAKNMVSYSDIPQIYFDEGLITKEDPGEVLVPENKVLPICVSIILLSIAFGVYYVIKKQKKVLKKKN